MAKRGVIKSVLRNFLATLISRNSDWDGYWAFGFLAFDLVHVDFDLLAPIADSSDTAILAFFRSFSFERFQDQIFKAHLASSALSEACLSIERVPEKIELSINGHASIGRHLRLIVMALSDREVRYRCEMIAAVAPHNPAFEIKSTRTRDPLQ